MLETSQALFLFKLLITLLLPTLGYPIRPTVTALFDPSTLDSCFINWMRCSAPIDLEEWMRVSAISVLSAIDFLKRLKEERWLPWLCRLALNMTTGYYLLKQVCQAQAFSIGTKSILFKIKMIFLSGNCSIFLQIYLHLHDIGSLASSTYRIMSHVSMIFFIYFQYLPDSCRFSCNSQPLSSYYYEDSQNQSSAIRCFTSGNFYFYKCSIILSRFVSLLFKD